MHCAITNKKLKSVVSSSIRDLNQPLDGTGIEFSGAFGSEIADGYSFKMCISDEAMAKLLLDGHIEVTGSYFGRDSGEMTSDEVRDYLKFVQKWKDKNDRSTK